MSNFTEVHAKQVVQNGKHNFSASLNDSEESAPSEKSQRSGMHRNNSMRSLKMEEVLGSTEHVAPFLVQIGKKQSSAPSKEVIVNIIKTQVEKHLQHSIPGSSPMSGLEEFMFGQLQEEDVVKKNIVEYGIQVQQLFHNSNAAVLYEQALAKEPDSFIASNGALCCSSGAKTGRSPGDKRIVKEASSEKDIWWGVVNIGISEKSYLTNRERAVDFLNLQPQLYVVDGFAGWDPEFRLQIRVITTRAYHALFMQNMLIMPTQDELENFKPDFLIYNAGGFPANRYTDGVTSQTHVSLHFGRGEMVILGTQYAGEMKKGVFTLMMYLMPKCGQLPLHSSCNVGVNGDISLFFGLSGTGKTTLSADPGRSLIGDDEHVWTDKGVFNIEGGCYAKCKDLTREQEPEIYDAIRFGSVLENVTIDKATRNVDYSDVSITENTRCAYPLKYISNSLIPGHVNTHPSNIILLTCDAFGVLPPVSWLSPEQAVYHFISGFTSKMAGTEDGVLEPTATFSACYGAPFLALHPMVYSDHLYDKLSKHATNAWLLNTGWIYGSYGSERGKRIPLKYSRAILDAIHDGTLANGEFEEMAVFGLKVPKHVESVPSEILMPSQSWSNQAAYNKQLNKLANLFKTNFEMFDQVSENVRAGGPV